MFLSCLTFFAIFQSPFHLVLFKFLLNQIFSSFLPKQFKFPYANHRANWRPFGHHPIQHLIF